MPRQTTIGRLLLEDALPPDLRPHLKELSSGGIRDLASHIANNHPEKYREVMKKLSDVANQVGFESGGYSFGPEDMEIGPQSHQVRENFRQQFQKILGDTSLKPADRNDKIIHAALMTMSPLEEAIRSEATAAKNPLALQVASGAKGSGSNLRSLIGGDVLYLDADDNPIAYPVLHSFGEGLRPSEYLAAAAGARKSVIQTKMSTAQGGYLAKRLNNVAHRLVVTSKDGDDPHGGVRGLPISLHDPDNEGALLAAPVGGHPRNTVLSRNIIADLKRKGVDNILIRSPIVGGPEDGGVYGRDVGVRERGGIAPRGDFVGLTAAQSVSEPATQSLISSKHTGGVAGQSKTQSGFPVIDRLFSIPSTFPGGAVHAQKDGLVNDVRDAPQGGKEIIVDGETHYADPDLTPTAKIGDRVEAGDALTDGIERPDELVRHKGIGEARRRFLDVFGKHAREAGIKYHRRNLELIARGLIDHVEMNQETNEHVPGDVVSYTALEHGYEPRQGHRIDTPKNTVGMYLERPALHYSIGTRITPRVASHLGEHGITSVTAHPEQPPFTPVMIRSNDVLSYDKDWMTQGLGSGIYDALLDSTARGSVSDPKGTSFVPALAEGVNFGAPGTKTRGWDRKDIEPVKL